MLDPIAMGTEGMEPAEMRRVRLTNIGAIVGLVLSLAWSAQQLAEGVQAASVNLFGASVFAATLVLDASGFSRVGRHLAIVGAMVHVALLCWFGPGAFTGVYRWYLAIALGAFLVLSERDRIARFVYAGVSLTAMFVADFQLSPFERSLRWSAEQLRRTQMLDDVSISLTLMVIVTLFVRDIRRAEAESEQLLLNILPGPIARRLRGGDTTIADYYPVASVLFADIVGFTPLAARLPADQLVRALDEIFRRFDEAAERLEIEKIKTIGDAYMVAAGVPEPHSDHAAALVDMGFEMRAIVASVAEMTGHDLQIRIGIHSGPVVAGVIGRKKFAYDLWGDTVNTAARMESHGAPGRIHISKATREALEGRYPTEPRGEIAVKGKGALETYFVEAPGESSSA